MANLAKTVSTVSGDFTIAPLTLSQTEKYFSPEGLAELNAGSNTSGPLTIIHVAIANAGGSATKEELKEQLCLRSLQELQDAIFDLTGLRRAQPGSDGSPIDFRDIYGCLITVTGWTLAECDALPFPRVLSLLEYWGEYPPVHLMVRGYLGIKGNREPAISIEEQEAMLATLPQANLKALPRDTQKDMEFIMQEVNGG